MEQEDNCKADDIFPFMCSIIAIQECIRAHTHNKWIGSSKCTDCLWLCLPCFISFDLVMCLPFTGIYICKKTCCKTKIDNNVDIISVQPRND
jgi:hypothetical protein